MRKLKNIRFVILILFVIGIPVYKIPAAISDTTYKVIEELDVKVIMRDGVRLSADIYRPDHQGEFPVLLMILKLLQYVFYE